MSLKQENFDAAVGNAETTMREVLPALDLEGAPTALLDAIAFNLQAILTPIQNELEDRRNGPVDRA